MSSETLSLSGPQSIDSKREARLLVQEAREYLAEAPPEPFQRGLRSPRKESARRIRNYTADRLFREEPRRYRLIASMRSNGCGIRETCRAVLCDARTIASVERRESESVTTMKPKLARGFGQLAKMTLERLAEEVPTMNQAQLAVTAGIATDKFLNLNGDPNQIIQHNISDNRENLFERIQGLAEGLAKVAKARVIEPEAIEV